MNRNFSSKFDDILFSKLQNFPQLLMLHERERMFFFFLTKEKKYQFNYNSTSQIP